MKLILDAWLDRPNASLRILDRETGSELLSWNNLQISSAIDSGLISTIDLEKAQPTDEELLSLVACMGQ